ncbi:hypothetical protein KBTX_03299 [wastewater metagenome]|uniref:Sulfotransferase domain-containing protein n=3 Tax=root TaxID=1 RepID=A0A5B8REI0_9ZZZZ|nr:hypothetical protein KBTEX_03299 [uncultured organism]
MELLEKPTVLIGSAGRTGTKFLGIQLGRIIEDAFSIHEADAIHLVNLQEDFYRIRLLGLTETVLGKLTRRTGTRNLSRRLLSHQISPQDAGRQLLTSRKRLHRKTDRQLIIESYGTLAAIFSAAPYAFKRWKGVGVVRDPRTWITSWEGHRTTKYGQGDRVQRFGLGRLSPEHLQRDSAIEVWPELSARERLAWYWATTTQILAEAETSFEAVRLYRFEDLFIDGHAIYDLVAFCADFGDRQFQYRDPAPFMNERINSSMRHGISDWRSWSDRDIFAVEFFCGRLMEVMGYSRDEAWMEAARRGYGRSPLARLSDNGGSLQHTPTIRPVE